MPLIAQIIFISISFLISFLLMFFLVKKYDVIQKTKHKFYWFSMLTCSSVIFLVTGIYAFFW